MKVTDPRTFGRVVVLMGGSSAERDVSLKSGNAVLKALLVKGVDAAGIDAIGDVAAKLRDASAQRVFIALHGRGGEDGVMQGALELIGIPYTGSGVLASAVGMDKWRTKLLWQGAGLPVPDYEMIDGFSDFAAVEQRLGLPLFVKPANEGSSVGVSKVRQVGETRHAWEIAAKYDSLVIAERFVGGGEYTVPVLNGHALPVIKIEPSSDFYDYEAKYLRDDTQYRCPCGLSAEQEKEMQRLAERAFTVLGGRGWGRIDILRDMDGKPYLLEANTVPGMTDHSLVPMAALAAGISFEDLVWQILEGSFDTAMSGKGA